MTDAALGAIPIAAPHELESPPRRALRRQLQRKGAVAGLVVIATFILLAVFAPLIVPYDPIATSWTLVRKPPSALHWFGTDDLGRDILSRVIYGARASLMAGAISVAIALGIGVPLGLLSGYRGGFIDALISRITDAMLACPFLILAIALAAFLGPSLGNAIAAILMRHTRSAMLQVLESDYVRTARAKGLSERSVILKHAMRNALTPVITLGALELGTLLSGAVLTEQIFSIPGFGKLIVDAVFNRDYAVVQGVVLVTATIYITLNLIADIAYILVNPRLRA
jgi:peptide/nickel transport system permease protein